MEEVETLQSAGEVEVDDGADRVGRERLSFTAGATGKGAGTY